jgi:hypothetical protein
MAAVAGEVPVERRAAVRHLFAGPGSNPLVATVGLQARCALVHDLSANGIGLLTTQSFSPGALIPVWLPGRHGQPSPLLLVCVVHSAPVRPGLYRIGGRFFDQASSDAASAFLPG